MNISAEARIPFPREAVFALFRDRLADVVERASNARIASVQDRTASGAFLLVKTKWHGGGGLPAAVRGIVTEAMLAWTTESIWSGDAFFCDWRIAADALLPDAVQCSGRTAFLVGEGGETSVRIKGEVRTDAKKLPGVPSFLATKVGRAVEEFLVAKIQSNLLEAASRAEEQLKPVG
jgi:hypothetical protein